MRATTKTVLQPNCFLIDLISEYSHTLRYQVRFHHTTFGRDTIRPTTECFPTTVFLFTAGVNFLRAIS